MKLNFPNFKKVYVWELPVRIFHWVNALCICVLIVTGYLIGHPPALMSGAEASGQFWFGWVRLVHFATAYVFVIVMIIRVYWAFHANKYARWKVFLPFSKKELLRMWYTIKHDILLQRPKPGEPNTESVGHNNVAAFSYLAMFFFGIVMICTGFALYEPNSKWFLPKVFTWVNPLLHGEFNVRLIHHFSMWAFILFIVIHVYLVLFHDWLEGLGEASSMISGFKYTNEERVKRDSKDPALDI